jgi:hypothetical protein
LAGVPGQEVTTGVVVSVLQVMTGVILLLLVKCCLELVQILPNGTVEHQ